MNLKRKAINALLFYLSWTLPGVLSLLLKLKFVSIQSSLCLALANVMFKDMIPSCSKCTCVESLLLVLLFLCPCPRKGTSWVAPESQGTEWETFRMYLSQVLNLVP